MDDMIEGTVRWSDGTPMGGVAVSNGINWDYTDEEGHFSLPPSTRPIWVRRPSGVTCSRWWQLPTARVLDFTCEPNFHAVSAFAHLSDTHLAVGIGDQDDAVELANRFGDGTDCARGLAEALGAASLAGAQFAVVTGDLTDHGTAAEFEEFSNVVASSPIPVEVIPGNHDHYGHRHDPHSVDEPTGDGFLGSATTWRYEQAIGPRWWSADIGPFHVLALDWFSYAADIDRAEQEAFAVADLAGNDPRRPLLVLSHDVPSDRMLELIAQALDPAASITILSGHWHVVVDRQIGPLRFLSAPPTSFGGFAWSPPSWHLLTVDRSGYLHRDTESTWRRHRPSSALKAAWQAPPRHTQHGGNLAPVGSSRLAIPTSHAGRAYVSVVDTDTWDSVWSMPLDGDTITSLTQHGADALIAVTFSGAITCLDSDSGQVRWTRTLPRARHARVLNAPVVTDLGTLIVGTLDHLTGLSVATGAELWTTDVLAPVDTLMTYGRGLASGHIVVLPFSGPYRGLTAVDARDGKVLWSQTSGPAPTSNLTPIPGTDHALVMRASSESIECIELTTGACMWRTDLGGKFTTVSPVPTSAGIVAITSDGTVSELDTATGKPLTKANELTLGSVDGWGPYRSTGIGIGTDPVAVGDHIIAATVSGDVWSIEAGESPLLLDSLAQHVTTRPAAISGERVAVLTTDAQLTIVSLPTDAAMSAVAVEAAK